MIYHKKSEFWHRKFSITWQNMRWKLFTANYENRLCQNFSRTVFAEGHWLPVESRIIFKLLLITFKIIHGLCPAYLSSLLQQYHPQRSLRSCSKLLFTLPSVNYVTYGERAFSFSAPILWNSLPDAVKNTTSLSSFKSALKAFLFRKSYFWFILFYEKLF